MAEPFESIEIESLALLPELQTRAALNLDAINDYAELYGLVPCPLPPVIAYQLPDDRIAIVDGFHRVEAAKAAGFRRIQVTIQAGTLDAARWAAAEANAGHGVRRTSADKRRAIAIALLSEENENESNRAIARHTGVSYELVRRVRADLSGNGAATDPAGVDTNVADRPDGDIKSRDTAPAGAGFYQSAAKKLRRVHGQICDLVGETDDLATSLAEVVALANQYATAELDAG